MALVGCGCWLSARRHLTRGDVNMVVWSTACGGGDACIVDDVLRGSAVLTGVITTIYRTGKV